MGFGVACQRAAEAWESEAAHIRGLRRRLERELLEIPGARLFGAAAEARLPGTTLVGFSGAPGQLVAIGLDLEGICVSTGAACTSGSLEPSPVLLALGVGSDVAAEGVRISLGWTTTDADIDALLEVMPGIVARVRAAGDQLPPAGARELVL